MSARIDRKVRSTGGGGGGPFDPSAVDIADFDQVGDLNNNTIVGTDSSGVLQSIPGFNLDPNFGGMNISKNVELDGTASPTLHNLSLSITSSANASDSRVVQTNLYAEIDPDSDGFNLGTNGNALTQLNLGLRHFGTSDTGSLNIIQSYSNVGNGTDAITVNGMAEHLAFPQFNANVTINGAMQGYIYQPTVHASAVMTSNAYGTAFGDFSTVATPTNGWTSFQSSPTISNVNTNQGVTSVNLNPQITTFTGTSGYTGLAVAGTYGTFGTGSFQGISINPNISTNNYAVGLQVDMSNVVGGTKYAANLVGDVSINGALTFTGALSIGQLQAYYATAPVDGGGSPLTLHGLTTGMNTVASTTVANADAIGVNTAMLISLAANSVTTSGPFQLGFTALALPCVVETHTGATLDYMSGTTTAISMAGSATGGTIDTVRINRSVVIPNGITTINNLYGFFYHQPFGGAATNTWGFYAESDVDNFFKQSLKIGGTIGTTDRVTNSSVALEVESTDRAVVLSRMDSTAEAALTALNGMVIYNTTTGKFRGYAGGAWVDLH